MKKYKIFAQKLEGKDKQQIGPFIIEGKNKKEAYNNALHHIKDELKLSSEYHIIIDEV